MPTHARTPRMHCRQPIVTVDIEDGNALVNVTLPDGWSRVWSGFVRPGDRFLCRLAAMQGETVWKPITFARLLECMGNGDREFDINDTAAWYCCVIRECSKETGEPCGMCRIRPPAEGFPECDICIVG